MGSQTWLKRFQQKLQVFTMKCWQLKLFARALATFCKWFFSRRALGEFSASSRSWCRRLPYKPMYNFATRVRARTWRNFAECLLFWCRCGFTVYSKMTPAKWTRGLPHLGCVMLLIHLRSQPHATSLSHKTAVFTQCATPMCLVSPVSKRYK